MKYWLIAVSSAVSTAFSASISWGSPRIAEPPVPARMDRVRRKGQPNENENGVRFRRLASACADETLDLAEAGGRGVGRLGRDDLADRRATPSAHASRAAGSGDLAPAARAFPHGLAGRG